MATVSLHTKVKAVILRARKSAKRLNLAIRDQDLYRLAKLVQENKADPVRRISKYRSLHRAEYNGQTIYFVYNTNYKIVDQFFSEQDALFNVRDKVWYVEDEVKRSGFIAIDVPPYSTPKFSAFEQGGFDLSKLPPTKKRPQRSYVMAVEEEGKHYLYWPHRRLLRKAYALSKKGSFAKKRGFSSSRDSFRGSYRQRGSQSR